MLRGAQQGGGQVRRGAPRLLNELGELGKAPWERGNWGKAGEGLTMRPSEREVWGGGRAWGGVGGAAAPEGALPRSEARSLGLPEAPAASQEPSRAHTASEGLLLQLEQCRLEALFLLGDRKCLQQSFHSRPRTRFRISLPPCFVGTHGETGEVFLRVTEQAEEVTPFHNQDTSPWRRTCLI